MEKDTKSDDNYCTHKIVEPKMSFLLEQKGCTDEIVESKKVSTLLVPLGVEPTSLVQKGVVCTSKETESFSD